MKPLSERTLEELKRQQHDLFAIMAMNLKYAECPKSTPEEQVELKAEADRHFPEYLAISDEIQKRESKKG